MKKNGNKKTMKGPSKTQTNKIKLMANRTYMQLIKKNKKKRKYTLITKKH
jgi:hypothetical protein